MQDGKFADFACGFVIGFIFGLIFVLIAAVMCRMNRMLKNGLILGFVARVIMTLAYASDPNARSSH